MAKPKVILPAEVIENWALGYDLGSAIVLIREAVDPAAAGKDSIQALKGAATHILKRVDVMSSEHLRATWRKNKKRVRAASEKPVVERKPRKTKVAAAPASMHSSSASAPQS